MVDALPRIVRFLGTDDNPGSSCITRWAHDKATADLDASICLIPTLAQNAVDNGDIEASAKRNGAVLREHQRIYNIWDKAKKERKL